MNAWRELTLADLASPDAHALATGPFGSAISSRHFVENGVPVLRGSNLSLDVGVRLIDRGLAFLTEEKAATFKRSMARHGDLVFTCWGTVGQVGLIDHRARFDEYVVSNKQMKLTPDPSKANSLFLYYVLSSLTMVREVQGQSIGAAVPGFNLGQLRAIRVNIPPLDVQITVSDVLGALDDLIENNRRRTELLEQMAQTIYREWFVRFRNPGHEEVTLVDSPLGPIPEGWEVTTLSALIDVDKGLSYKGAHLTETGVPMANLKCFRPGGGFRRDGTKPYSGAFKQKHRVAPGDLIMANTDLTQAGSVIGSPAFIPRRGFESGGIISHHLFAIRCRDQSLIPWLYRVFRDERFRSFARGVASGTTVLGFRPADLLSFQLACPPVEEYRRFSALAGDLHAMAQDLDDAADELGAIRDLLLPKLVTGQIDVSNLDVDPLVGSVA